MHVLKTPKSLQGHFRPCPKYPSKLNANGALEVYKYTFGGCDY